MPQKGAGVRSAIIIRIAVVVRIAEVSRISNRPKPKPLARSATDKKIFHLIHNNELKKLLLNFLQKFRL